jgi:hypothetical protein
MKKLLLIFLGIFLTTISLSGCSNKYNNFPLHSEKYYSTHIKQRNLILKQCNKLTPQEIIKNKNSNLAKDCSNAANSETIFITPPPPPSNLDLYKTH